jgi:hypothetical protein
VLVTAGSAGEDLVQGEHELARRHRRSQSSGWSCAPKSPMRLGPPR